MDNQFDDLPSFSHQRRNVMWLSCLIIFASIVGAKLDDLVVFGIYPKRPEVIIWVLLVVLIYFVWRYYQVSTTSKVHTIIQGIYFDHKRDGIERKARKVALTDLITTGKVEAKKQQTEPPNSHYDTYIAIINGSGAVTGGANQLAKFIYQGNVSWISDNGNAYSINSNSEVKISLLYWENIIFKVKCFFIMCFRSTVFTEYALPYLLALVAMIFVIAKIK